MKSRYVFLPVIAILFASSAFAVQTVYKCTDKYGRHFYNYEAEPKTSKSSIKCKTITKLSPEDVYNAQKVKAVNLLTSKKYPAAYREYINLLKQNPLDDDVVMGLALAAEKSEHNNQAVMAYEILQERHPEDDIILSGLARNQEILGDSASAESVKEKVKEAPVVNAPVIPPVISPMPKETKKSVPEKLEQKPLAVVPEPPKLAPVKQEKTFIMHGNLNTGIMYDSNANSGPASENLQLGNWQVIVPAAKEKGTFAGFLGGGLNIAQRMVGRLWLVADAQVNGRWNENSALDETHNRATHYARVAAGLRYVGTKTMTDVKIKTEVFDYELWQRMSAPGVNILFVYAATPDLFLTTSLTADHRDYSKSNGRNGGHVNLGQYIKYFMADKKYSLTISGAFEHEDSKDNYYGYNYYYHDYGYDGWRVGFGFSARPVDALEIAPFVQVARDFYFSPATILETHKRRDNKVTLGTAANYNLTKRWMLNAMYSYTSNDSNSELYEFDKHLVQIGTRYEF